MKHKNLNYLRQSKDSYYKHPYTTKGVNVKELLELPIKYPNDAELGKAFRSLITNAQEIQYTKQYKKDGVE